MLTEQRCPYCGKELKFDTKMFLMYPTITLKLKCIHCWSKLVVTSSNFHCNIEVVEESVQPTRSEVEEILSQQAELYVQNNIVDIIEDVSGTRTLTFSDLTDEQLLNVMYIMLEKNQSML